MEDIATPHECYIVTAAAKIIFGNICGNMLLLLLLTPKKSTDMGLAESAHQLMDSFAASSVTPSCRTSIWPLRCYELCGLVEVVQIPGTRCCCGCCSRWFRGSSCRSQQGSHSLLRELALDRRLVARSHSCCGSCDDIGLGSTCKAGPQPHVSGSAAMRRPCPTS